MRFGVRKIRLAGLALVALGFALLTRAPAHSDYLRNVFLVMVLLGIGPGLSFPPADEAGYGRHDAQRRGARLQPAQHDDEGGRLARSRGACHSLHPPDESPACLG